MLQICICSPVDRVVFFILKEGCNNCARTPWLFLHVASNLRFSFYISERNISISSILVYLVYNYVSVYSYLYVLPWGGVMGSSVVLPAGGLFSRLYRSLWKAPGVWSRSPLVPWTD